MNTESNNQTAEESKNMPPANHVHYKNGKVAAAIVILTIIISSAFGSIFGFMAGGIGQKALNSRFSGFFGANNATSGTVKEKITEEDSAVINVVEKSTPAVVSIVISKDVSNLNQDPFNFPNFFDPFGQTPNSNNNGSNNGGTQKQKIGGGTGFLISADGMIVTNKHVVSDANAQYTVVTNDGKEHDAKVLAIDPNNDIAVIKIDGSDYPTLNFGNSDNLKTGQTVIAIGNSLGEFSNTVSRGIISGLRRNVTAGDVLGDTEKLTNIIQTDAAINPGNSGGPLIDIDGNVIGINVAIAQGAQNIGFAIPGNQVKKVIDQIKSTGKITTPYIGVRYVPIDAAIQQNNNLPFNYGALVLRGQNMSDLAVIPGSPADKAGIVENDIILEVDGTKIDDTNSLVDLISQHNVGDTVTLKVWHKGETKDLQVKLEERKS